MAEVATGKMSAPFTTLSSMVLSHATEEGAANGGGENSVAAGARSLVDNLKSMLAKPKAKAA
jgi:pilus assembly protein CpaE